MSDPNKNMVMYHVTRKEYQAWLINDFNQVSLTMQQLAAGLYGFGPTTPVNKLVSLTWLLWALCSFKILTFIFTFTLHSYPNAMELKL